MSNDIANHIAEATRNNNLSTSAINEYPYWVQSIMADEEETLAVQENHYMELRRQLMSMY